MNMIYGDRYHTVADKKTRQTEQDKKVHCWLYRAPQSDMTTRLTNTQKKNESVFRLILFKCELASSLSRLYNNGEKYLCITTLVFTHNLTNKCISKKFRSSSSVVLINFCTPSGQALNPNGSKCSVKLMFWAAVL